MMNLERLRQERLEWVESTRKNKFDSGINRLLTDLYPDNAHFIYELLQNAEDPRATSVSFTLTDSEVKFEHNGERLFALKDVESITSIGNSTKRDDATSIGKFGVGFKAVFAYTSSPEIHSGDFNFQIHDLVVPEALPPPSEHDPKKTTFIFPFNNPKKPPITAKSEIERGLRNLGDNTLLFLSHIRKIDYVLPDGSNGYLQRVDHENGRIEIRMLHPGGMETVSNWLHFQKEVVVLDDNSEPKTCTVAIAFSLVQEKDKKTEKNIWKIEPLNQGQVSIYFPAEKETSNLYFHIHAPFASTVARDSVRDCGANHILRDCISELVVESLVAIRDQDMLTVSFLAVLPNPEDNLTSFYVPIQQAVVDAFSNQNLTPTRSGMHAHSSSLYRGPAAIANILSDDDLSFLTNYSTPLWVANPPPQNRRAEDFLNSLGIEEWGWTELAEKFNWPFDDKKSELEDWISQKEDAWILRLYVLLGEACEDHDQHIDTDELKIVRVLSKEGIDHLVSSEVFFPPVDDDVASSSISSFVKPEVYSTKGTERQKTFAKSFLKYIGVKTLNKEVLIDKMLDKYEPLVRVQINQEYFKDLRQFISYWKVNPHHISKFKNKVFLLNHDKKWCKADSLYLDIPFRETGLSGYEEVHKKDAIWPGYQDKLPEKQIKDFIDFIVSLGIMVGLKIAKAMMYLNPDIANLRKGTYGVRESGHAIEDDYNISKINDYLNLKSIGSSLLIWDAIINADSKVAKARYRPNLNYLVRETDSQLVHDLKNHEWIPDSKGVFYKPQDISREDLRKDFPYDDRNGLLTAICLGENARKRNAEYQAKNMIAKAAGFESAEKAEKWATLEQMGISPDELLAQYKKTEQPEESVPNPERRRNGVLDRNANSPSKQSIIRERSIQPGIADVVANAKAYLRAKYTNINHEMVCQCCQQVMPFKIGDEYYFEAVQCIKETKNHHIENRLALCPTCAAMYQYARKTDDLEVRHCITENNSPDEVSSVIITLELAGQECELRFVGTHWFDLREVLALSK